MSADGCEVELAFADTQQHLRVGPQVAELVDLVVPAPVGAEMRTRRMRGIEHVRDERLRPRVAVEARADDLSVLVPLVTRVGRGVDRADRHASGADAFHDRALLLRAPGRLADREQRECAGLLNGTDGELAHVLDPPGAQPVHLGDLFDAYRGLVEHSVHARGPVAIRRDLGDEQQRVSHDAAR